MFVLSIKHDGTEADISYKGVFIDESEKYKKL